MKLSQTVKYAIHATLELSLANSDRPMSCNKLAKRGKLPERFLLQILRRLVETNVLCSARGVDGGYYLSKSANQITVLDIVESFDPMQPAVPEFSGLAPEAQDRIAQAIYRINETARGELKKLKIGELNLASNQIEENFSGSAPIENVDSATAIVAK